GREHHAGLVGVELALDDDRHTEIPERALDPAVEESTGSEERGPTPAHEMQHLLGSSHIEVGVLLAGIAGGCTVLGACTGSDSHAASLVEAQVCVADGVGPRPGAGRAEN